MFNIDDTFLEAAGYSNLSGERRIEVMQELSADLTDRVTSRLVADLSEDELVEFSQLVDAEDDTKALTWLHEHKPDFEQSEDYIAMKDMATDDDSSVVREYAVFAWLEKHKPDFHAIIEEEMKQLAEESRRLREDVARRLTR